MVTCSWASCACYGSLHAIAFHFNPHFAIAYNYVTENTYNLVMHTCPPDASGSIARLLKGTSGGLAATLEAC